MADIGLSGGAGLMKRLAELSRGLSKPATVRAGFLETARYPNGLPVAAVAAANEFGTSRGVPPRPFFRTMIKQKSPTWGDDIARLLDLTHFDAATTMDNMGKRIVGQLRQSIQDTNSPPLAKATIAAKSRGKVRRVSIGGVTAGPEKPLIDTGIMWNSAGYEVT